MTWLVGVAAGWNGQGLQVLAWTCGAKVAGSAAALPIGSRSAPPGRENSHLCSNILTVGSAPGYCPPRSEAPSRLVEFQKPPNSPELLGGKLIEQEDRNESRGLAVAQQLTAIAMDLRNQVGMGLKPV